MEFKEYRLFELSKDNKGYYGIGASAVEYDKNLYTYLRITDIKDDGSLNYSNLKSVNDENANKFILENGDIVFARTGNSTGKSYYYDGEILNLVYAGFLIKFSLNEKKVNPKFIKYYTMTNEYKNWVKEIQTGSTRGNINEKMYGNMRIKLPPRYYQDEVVSLLDKIDKKIKINNQINDNLYKFAINYLNNKKEETEVPIRNFAKIQGGYAFKSKDLIDNKTKNRIIKIKNLRSELNADVINSQFVEDKVIISLDSKFKLRTSDVTIAMTGAELGKTGFIYGFDNYYLNQRVGVIRGNNKEKELYLKILFLSDKFQSLLNSKGYGSAQSNISSSDIENILVNDITEVNLKDIYENLNSVYNRIISNCEENLNLERLQGSLLPKLMNGEIDLDKLEI